MINIRSFSRYKNIVLNMCLVILSTSFFFQALLRIANSEVATLSWKALPLPEKLANSEILVVNINNQEVLYSFGGGHSLSSISQRVRYAPFSTAGVPENWQMASPLPISLKNHTVVFYENMIFVIGGKTNLGEVSPTSEFSNRVYCGQLD